MNVYVCVCAVHELLDYEIESTGIPPERIIVGESIITPCIYFVCKCLPHYHRWVQSGWQSGAAGCTHLPQTSGRDSGAELLAQKHGE